MHSMNKAILNNLQSESEQIPAKSLRRAFWFCNHQPDASDIVALSEKDKRPQIVARAFSTPHKSAHFHAELIVSAVNNQEQMKEIINEMIGVLEMCLESGGLTWKAEQEAEFVSNKARQII